MRKTFHVVLGILGVLIAACAPAPTPVTPAPPAATVEPSPEAKSGTLRYGEIFIEDIRNVPTLMAFDELQAQGYVVERTAYQSSSLVAEGLARGEVDMASLNVATMWAAVVEGVEARTIMQRIGSTQILVARQGLATCDDLDGRPVVVQSLTGVNPRLLELYFEQNCPDSEPQFIVIPETDGRLAALLSGEADAGNIQLELWTQLEADMPGEFYVMAPIYQLFRDVQVNGIHVRQEWAQANPQLVRDFVETLLTVHRRVIADPQVLYDEAVARVEVTPEEAKTAGDLYLEAGLWDPNGSMTEVIIEENLEFLVELGELEPGLTAADVADMSYLEDVLAEIGRQ